MKVKELQVQQKTKMVLDFERSGWTKIQKYKVIRRYTTLRHPEIKALIETNQAEINLIDLIKSAAQIKNELQDTGVVLFLK